jgi:hypothetical protein
VSFVLTLATWKKMKSSIFWVKMQYSQLKINRRFGEICSTGCHFVALLAYSSTLKMEAKYSSEALVDFQSITWFCIRDDRTLHNHCSEKPKRFSNAE